MGIVQQEKAKVNRHKEKTWEVLCPQVPLKS